MCLKEDTGSKTEKKGMKKWKSRQCVRTGYQTVLTGSRLGNPAKWPGVRTVMQASWPAQNGTRQEGRPDDLPDDQRHGKEEFSLRVRTGQLPSWPAQEVTRQEGRPDDIPDDQRTGKATFCLRVRTRGWPSWRDLEGGNLKQRPSGKRPDGDWCYPDGRPKKCTLRVNASGRGTIRPDAWFCNWILYLFLYL